MSGAGAFSGRSSDARMGEHLPGPCRLAGQEPVAHSIRAAPRCRRGRSPSRRGVSDLRAVDLFCCGGGAAIGLLEAGFEVVGVDVDPKPEYPGRTVKADVLGLDPAWLATFDLVWASPPCQAASTTRNLYDPRHELPLPELVEPTRELLSRSRRPYVIENVPGAGQRPDVMLCGSMFGLPIIRHRDFELGGWHCAQPAHLERCKGREGLITLAGSGQGLTVAVTAAALGVPHIRTRWALNQIVPPAYACWLASQWRVWSLVDRVGSLLEGDSSIDVGLASASGGVASAAWWVPSIRRRETSPAGGVASHGQRDPSSSSRVASLDDRETSQDLVVASCRCGLPLLAPGPEGGRPSLHCSKACRQAAWRERRRADNPADR